MTMRRGLLYFLFFLSGLAGLGYEILWTRMLSVSLGHEIVAVLAVIGAFFSSLAMGAWILDRPVSRSARPGLWYGGCELVIGCWAAVLVVLIPLLNPLVASWIGVNPTPVRHWTIAFFYPFILLLPATVAMGGTLPAMDRFFCHTFQQKRCVGGLYSANTFGAMAGTLLTTFWLMPAFGLQTTALFLALVNCVGAVGVFLLAGKRNNVAFLERSVLHSVTGTARLYVTLFAAGLLGIGFEVLMVRVFSQIFENTVFSFASILIVFLFGTAIGASIYQRAARKSDFEQTLSSLLLAVSLCCLAAVFLLRYAETLFSAIKAVLPGGFWAGIGAEMILALFFLLLPTAAMGATFSHLAQALRRADGGVGRALCLNTLGSAMAPLLVGVGLLPVVGCKYTLLLAAVGYLTLLPSLKLRSLVPGLLAAALALGIGVNSYPYRFVSLDEGESIVDYREGVMASVSVIKDKNEDLHLKVNNHLQMGGTTSVFSDWRQALLPLLLHPRPQNALFLGLGTGATFAAAAYHPGLEADGVELIPEVIDVMGHFEKSTGHLDEFKNLHIFAGDARRFVTATDNKYDVVVADLFHPGRDGAGSLYTVEHFRAISRLLSKDGLFCQWLPLYQLDLDMFKVITRTFLEVFPDGQAYLGHYSLDYPIIALIGSTHKLRFPERWYNDRLWTKGLQRTAMSFGYDSIYSLLGTFLAGKEKLRAYVGDSPINTDNRPVVLFQAPLYFYGKQETPPHKLLALIEKFSPENPESILDEIVTEEDLLARRRLAAYWKARDSFLKVGMDVEKTSDVVKLYQTVSKPLLTVVRKSIDFSAAYFPLLSIAYDIYPYDHNISEQLLLDLEKANPIRPEASILHRKLFDGKY
jgi:spermidine synthase